MRSHYRDKAWVREEVERVEVEAGYTEAGARTREAELIEEHDPPRNQLWPSAPAGEPLPYIPDATRDGNWWQLPVNVRLDCEGCDDPLTGRPYVRYFERTVTDYLGGTYIRGYWELRELCPSCGTTTVGQLDDIDLRNAVGFEPPPFRWRRLEDDAELS